MPISSSLSNVKAVMSSLQSIVRKCRCDRWGFLYALRSSQTGEALGYLWRVADTEAAKPHSSARETALALKESLGKQVKKDLAALMQPKKSAPQVDRCVLQDALLETISSISWIVTKSCVQGKVVALLQLMVLCCKTMRTMTFDFVVHW